MRKKLVVFLSFLSLSIGVCHAQSNDAKKSFLSFEKIERVDKNLVQFSHSPALKKAWYSNSLRSQIDLQTLYNNHSSLMLRSTIEDNAQTYFHLSNRDIVGKKIVFSGRYKFADAKDAKADFSITLHTFALTAPSKNVEVKCVGSGDWKTFSVEMPLDRTEHFFFSIACVGEMTLWVADCQVRVDGQSFDVMVDPTSSADLDFDFLESSSVAIVLPNPQTFENLEVLGKVWGFLKYFHPEVVTGKYNWDFELFRVLPSIAKAKDTKERNQLLSKWIDKYGEIVATEDYTVRDSTQYHRFASLEWLEDPSLFDAQLSAKLVRIKNAKRNSVFNYYLVPLSGKEEVEFTRENPYARIGWRDQGYRLLTLYRLWNAIEYCFPYTNYTDNKWSTLLAKYLPEFLNAPTEESLDYSIQKLASEINDSHGSIVLNKRSPQMRGLPMSLTQTVDGQFVVESTRISEIDRGAVILGVNGKSVSEMVEYYRPIVPSSNERGLIRNVSQRLFLTPEPQTNVTFDLKKERYESKTVPTQTFTRDAHQELKKPEEYKLKGKEIVYIDLGEASAEEMVEKLRQPSKGLILDLRKYPKGYTKNILDYRLFPKPTEFMWFSMNSKKYPGNFFFDMSGNAGFTDNPQYYKGKIAILVNENTQSLGEMYAIALRVAPQSAVIGTQTAGANGHVGYLFLPRGIRFTYTMAGAFYPAWKPNQRVGVTIDIPVEQTVADVEAGEDMWIKKAIEYIEGN